MKVSEITTGARLICPGRTYRQPRVSIVTPTFRRNAEGLLAKCLDSAMAQTFEDFELIVIDDGSTDGSEFTIRDAAFRDDRIVYVRHDTNCGVPAIRTNEGIMRARGDAVAFLFDDNIYRPDFIEAAWDMLESSGADVVHTHVHMLTKQGKDFTLGGWPLTLELLRNLNTIPNGGVLIRRSFFEKYGLYDPHILMRRICDWDLWLRALALGAKFCHLDRISAVEHGLVSENSVGNTIRWDVKVAYAYMLDEANFAARSKRLTPRKTGEYDFLDPSAVRPYVRDQREWTELIESVYAPFLSRHGANGFDPAFPGNRAASLDPHEGWNAEWSVVANRRRYLVVSNSINAWASAWLHALRREPGAIVVNCPEWQLSAFGAADVDLVILLDCTGQFLKTQLDALRAASVPVLYVSGYGEQQLGTVPAAMANRHFVHNQHIAELLGPDFYFPQAGVAFGPTQREGAKLLAVYSYAFVAADADAGRMGVTDHIPFPFASVSGADASAPHAQTIKYGVDIPNSLDCDEIVALPDTVYFTRDGACVRPSWEGVGALAESRSGARIIVDSDVLAAAPLSERVGLAAISQHHSVQLDPDVPAMDVDRDGARADHPVPEAWQDWIGNVALCSQLSRQISQARRVPAERPRVGVFLNSEMFSGSEVYGLMLARGLQQVGCRVEVFFPEQSPYGRDADAGRLNDWLTLNGIPAAKPAPYRAGAAYLSLAPADRSAMTERLSAFVRSRECAVIICAGFMPAFAALSDMRGLLFMALFQPSAYQQQELAFLRGRVSGILSDSVWALTAHQSLVGGPSAVVRAMLPVDPATPRVIKSPRITGPVHIAIGGTLQPRKRQLQAVEAIGILRDRGVPLVLNIYGYQLDMLEGYLKEIDAAISANRLQGLVRCHGFVTPHDIARDNDVVLMASVDESLPQTLVELMRLGLIGVAGLSGGIDEVIEDGKTGYLTEDLSPGGLADLLWRAIDDRDRWPEVSANGRALIEREYSIGSNTTTLLNLMIAGAQIESTPFGRLAPA